MLFQIHAVVQHAADFQTTVCGNSDEQEVSRLPHPARGLGNVVATVEEMVGQRVSSEFWAGLTSRSLRVGRGIKDGTNEQRFVAKASSFAEVLMGPCEDRFQIRFGERR